jgi:hypothetical protein
MTLDTYPATFGELVTAVNALGHSLNVVPFEYSGERLFGHLERVLLNGKDCIAKYAGPETSEMFVVSANAVQQERDGLQLARGLATPLVAEVRVDGQVVAVFREYTEGEPLKSAVKNELLDAEDARLQVENLVTELTKSGLHLWDCNPDNIWRRPDGTVVLLEGQCIVPSEMDQAALVEANTLMLNAMFPLPTDTDSA